MAFCENCGGKIGIGAKFCSQCGAAVRHSENVRVQEFAGKIIKCPNCGGYLKSFDAICPECGFQITGKGISASTVAAFSEQLKRIDEEKVFSLNPFRGMMAKGYGDAKFEKKVTLIKNFPIPNTVEEITEFLLLAATNIDVRFGKNTLSNKLYGKPGFTYYADITLANTWINKMQQAYNKAKLSFPEDPMFEKVKDIYINKMTELKIKV